MAALLLPGIPGSGLPTAELRHAFITAHPMRWHFGWFPWHLCALSDLAISASLLTARWIPRRASIFTFTLTVIAFAIEQYYETLWDILGPRTSPSNYAAFEHHVFLMVCAVAASLYAIMAMGWSWSLSFLKDWTRWLTVISCIAWPVLLFAASAPLCPQAIRPPQLLIDLGNKLGFALMLVWFVLALEAVLRRTRVTEPFGRMAAWKAPRRTFLGWLCELIANSRFLQYACEFGPRFAMASDIRDVVYINYVVPARNLLPLVPEGLELLTLAEDRYALLSVLIYKHGAFGMNFLGPLRRPLMPSPLQSNWRIYVREPRTSTEGVFFFSNTISGTLTALIARILSRGVAMHVPAEMSLNITTEATLREIPGTSCAPDLIANLRSLQPTEQPTLPSGPWTECFASYAEFLAYCIPQGNALSVQSWDGRITAQNFCLEGVAATSTPLQGEAHSATLTTLGATDDSICFLLPRVDFLLTGETTLQPGTP